MPWACNPLIPHGMVSTSAPDVSADTAGALHFTTIHDMNVQAKSLENLRPFQVGNPGGPGRTPEKVPAFLRRLSETDDPKEVERLVLSGMRNPLIAAKLRAIQAEDPELANKATEQVWDRVFGRATQRTEVSGQVDLRALMTGDAGDAFTE